MTTTSKKSWLPKRSGGSFKRESDGSWVTRDATDGRFMSTKSDGSRSQKGNVSGNIRLPNGDVITTVRKDVMDRALGRGEYKKK